MFLFVIYLVRYEQKKIIITGVCGLAARYLAVRPC